MDTKACDERITEMGYFPFPLDFLTGLDDATFGRVVRMVANYFEGGDINFAALDGVEQTVINMMIQHIEYIVDREML